MTRRLKYNIWWFTVTTWSFQLVQAKLIRDSVDTNQWSIFFLWNITTHYQCKLLWVCLSWGPSLLKFDPLGTCIEIFSSRYLFIAMEILCIFHTARTCPANSNIIRTIVAVAVRISYSISESSLTIGISSRNILHLLMVTQGFISKRITKAVAIVVFSLMTCFSRPVRATLWVMWIACFTASFSCMELVHTTSKVTFIISACWIWIRLTAAIVGLNRVASVWTVTFTPMTSYLTCLPAFWASIITISPTSHVCVYNPLFWIQRWRVQTRFWITSARNGGSKRHFGRIPFAFVSWIST